MTKQFRFMAIAVITVVFVASLGYGFVVFSQRTRSEKETVRESAPEVQWEYLVVSGGNLNVSTSGNDSSMRKQSDFSREAYPLERNLDKLGLKGWELVAVHGTPVDPVFFLKRPKESR